MKKKQVTSSKSQDLKATTNLSNINSHSNNENQWQLQGWKKKLATAIWDIRKNKLQVAAWKPTS